MSSLDHLIQSQMDLFNFQILIIIFSFSLLIYAVVRSQQDRTYKDFQAFANKNIIQSLYNHLRGITNDQVIRLSVFLPEERRKDFLEPVYSCPTQLSMDSKQDLHFYCGEKKSSIKDEDYGLVGASYLDDFRTKGALIFSIFNDKEQGDLKCFEYSRSDQVLFVRDHKPFPYYKNLRRTERRKGSQIKTTVVIPIFSPRISESVSKGVSDYFERDILGVLCVDGNSHRLFCNERIIREIEKASDQISVLLGLKNAIFSGDK